MLVLAGEFRASKGTAAASHSLKFPLLFELALAHELTA